MSFLLVEILDDDGSYSTITRGCRISIGTWVAIATSSIIIRIYTSLLNCYGLDGGGNGGVIDASCVLVNMLYGDDGSITGVCGCRIFIGLLVVIETTPLAMLFFLYFFNRRGRFYRGIGDCNVSYILP